MALDKEASEYPEVGIDVVKTSINDKTGGFTPIMYVDQYAAMIGGREI